MINSNFFIRIAKYGYIFFYLFSIGLANSQLSNNDFLMNFEDALNKRNYKVLDKIYISDKKVDFLNNFSKVVNDFPNAKWEIKERKSEGLNNFLASVQLRGSKLINGKRFILDSSSDCQFIFESGKLKDILITNQLTTIRNDNNQIDLKIQIPNNVLTGANYNLDIFIVEPSENEIIAGDLREYQNENLLIQKNTLKPLVSGGIYKVTRAPIKSGIQIWTGIIAHPKGLISFTKTVNIIND